MSTTNNRQAEAALRQFDLAFADFLADAGVWEAAFDLTERRIVLAAVAADAILWRDGACDLALLFLGATLLGLPEVSMENVGMALGSLVRGAKIGARTTRSPAHRGASPWAALTRPVHDDTNVGCSPKSGWRIQRNFVSVFCRLEAMHMKCMLWFESCLPSHAFP